MVVTEALAQGIASGLHNYTAAIELIALLQSLGTVRYINANSSVDMGKRINAEFAFIENVSPDGGTVVLPYGSHDYSTPIDFGHRSNICLQGFGMPARHTNHLPGKQYVGTELHFTGSGSAILLGPISGGGGATGEYLCTDCRLQHFQLRFDATADYGVYVRDYAPANYLRDFSVRGPYIVGTHNGGNNSATLIDTTENFTTLGVVIGSRIVNTTDGCTGIVTAISTTTNSDDTLTFGGGLSGGTDNDFDDGDNWTVRFGVGFFNEGVSNHAWHFHNAQFRRCVIGADLSRIHNFSASGGTAFNVNDIGCRIGNNVTGGGNYNFYGVNAEGNTDACFEIVDGVAINFFGGYSELKTGFADRVVFRIGDTAEVPSDINIVGYYVNAGSTANYIFEVNRVAGLTVAGCHFTGAADVINNVATDVERIMLPNNRYANGLINDLTGVIDDGAGRFIRADLPTSDPGIDGAFYYNGSTGVMSISYGN